MTIGITDCSGFDVFTTPSKYFNSVSSNVATTVTVVAAGRNGSSALDLHGEQEGAIACSASKTLAGPLTTLWIGFALKLTAFPSTLSKITFLELSDAGLAHLNFTLLSNGKIQVSRGDGTVLGTTVASILVNTFYHIEIKAVIDNSAGIVEIRINETPDAGVTLSGVDTQNGGVAQISEVTFKLTHDGYGYGNDVDILFDDLIVRDDEWGGDCAVNEALPGAVGNPCPQRHRG